MAGKLNDQQERFVEEYLVDLNATAAAKRSGYSEKTAYSQGQRLLKHAEVQKALAKGMAERSKRVEISQDRVLFELACLGFSNMQDFVTTDPDGNEITADILGLHRQHAAAISEYTVDKDGKVKVKLSDKRAALVDIGKHLGMWPNRHELTGANGQPLIPRLDLDNRVELGRRLAFTLAEAAHNMPAEEPEVTH